MAKVLRQLSVEFGSLVDEPANKGARIMLFKRDAAKAGKKPCDDNENEEDMPMKKETKKADETAAETKVEEPKTETAPAETKAAEPTEKKAPETKAEPAPETVSKADYEALRKRLDEQEQLTKREYDLRVTREYIEKAQGFKNLPVKAADFGPILKRMAENALTDADRTEIERVLKAADAGMGDLFVEKGRPGGDTARATDRVDALAKELVTKKEASNYAEAIAKIMRAPEHRELVREYETERN